MTCAAHRGSSYFDTTAAFAPAGAPDVSGPALSNYLPGRAGEVRYRGGRASSRSRRARVEGATGRVTPARRVS